LMYQKEVGSKMIENIAKKNTMGSLKALCTNFFETSLLRIVKPGAFSPPPKVDSIVINFKRQSSPEVELEVFDLFEKFLRALFVFKRKQIHHGLKNLVEKKDIDEHILKDICPKTIRAEALDLSQIFSLFKNYRTYIK
jgi:16S rRNA (adenine1518-N6/adenine1519-N6)-dimethyltransferase